MTISDPRREAGLRIIETSRLLRNLVEQRLKPYGMTRAQYASLARLERQEGLVQGELADLLEVQPIAMVRLIDQLCADGLIERRPDPDDRRCNRLFITSKGRARLHEMADFKERLGSEIFDGIGKEDLQSLLATLDQLHRNIKSIQSLEATAARAAKVKAS